MDQLTFEWDPDFIEYEDSFLEENLGSFLEWDPFTFSSASFLDLNWMFNLDSEFDIVLLNPPYSIRSSSLKDYYPLDKLFQKDNKYIYLATLFLDITKNCFVNKDGILSCITPQSILVAQKWRPIFKALIPNISILADLGACFDRVSIKTICFIYNQKQSCKNYSAYILRDDQFFFNTYMPKNLFEEKFRMHNCHLSWKQISLGLKIYRTGIFLADIARNTRGLGPPITEVKDGDKPIITGTNISKYYFKGLENCIRTTTAKAKVESKKIGDLLQPKIVSRLMLFTDNMISTIDIEGIYLVNNSVICTFIKDNKYSLKFLLAILNSTAFKWYYRHFIFSSSIGFRKIDDYYLNKMPIPIVSFEEQEPIISLVEELLILKSKDLNNEKVSLIEEKIDIFIYDLYKLTPAEISLINQ